MMEKYSDTAGFPASPWKDGWLQTVHHHRSPNFGPRPADATIDLVVLHSISLPPGEYGTGAVQSLFSNTLDWDAHPYYQSIKGLQVSSHFYINRLGVVWQFVSCKHRAWHAGASSYMGKTDCNNHSIGIELEGTDTDTFTEQQYQALQVLCSAIGQAYPIKDIAGHEHIAPDRKTDPGPGLHWTKLQMWTELQTWSFPPRPTAPKTAAGKK